MARIETVAQHLGGMEFPEPIDDFVDFVEDFVVQERPFSIHQNLSSEQKALEEETLPIRRPLMGYSGRGTFPVVADPDELVPGSFVIANRSIIYNREGGTLLRDRDAYRWTFTPYQYYINEGFSDILDSFVRKGYPVMRSSDTYFDFGHGRFKNVSPATLRDITKRE